MGNIIRDGDNLVPVNYNSLLQQILHKLSEHNLFKISSDVATALAPPTPTFTY
ncbi:MAG: hypothetical protein F6K22_29370 [Okeania sp. SIO2F4]|uniref:hypothetical protein n=1 Tax=Okeania sp. SIO2F4 TaxID=2607790 RepID=UPI00142A5139|nr:hypothetical protein [Okeania sp. SIO2F4]NES06567.1 hypothetical protein [Okeania sp. SIO2F4]